MRDIVKMALTLLIIGAVCGALLSVAQGVTAPIIERRQQAEFIATLESFFPEVDQFEEETIDEETFFVCYDDAGDLIGVVGNVKADGYGGDIQYILGVDHEGTIVGIKVQDHEETPGIGDVIEKEEFTQGVIGLNVEDPITIGADVDTISGATLSSGGMLGSIRRVMDLIGEEYLDFEQVEINISEVPDGTYSGTARGGMDDITVEVTVENGEITSIEVVDINDSPGYYEEAVAEMPGRIKEEQQTDVDVVSGSTMSSEGIIRAVEDALAQ